ncbi:MAG TPA: hypothetical protein VM848_03510, partial [Acidimicrobiia bacterium]|nr:hypothetical protein [Acidimicrobiia bacterium]
LLATAGLRDVEVSPIDFNYEAATFDEYWQALQEGTVRMSSLLHGQSKETRLRIRDALKQKLNEHRAPTDTITLPVAVKLAAGRKSS